MHAHKGDPRANVVARGPYWHACNAIQPLIIGFLLQIPVNKPSLKRRKVIIVCRNLSFGDENSPWIE